MRAAGLGLLQLEAVGGRAGRGTQYCPPQFSSAPINSGKESIISRRHRLFAYGACSITRIGPLPYQRSWRHATC